MPDRFDAFLIEFGEVVTPRTNLVTGCIEFPCAIDTNASEIIIQILTGFQTERCASTRLVWIVLCTFEWSHSDILEGKF